MLKGIVCLLITLTLSSCMFRVHRQDIEQGNIITPEQVSRLHLGMTAREVKSVMGTPVLVNIFTADRIEYVYTSQKAYQQRTEQRIGCIFQHGRLRGMERL